MTSKAEATKLDRFLQVKPDIDYLAKDYASFRQLMIDHLSVLTPDWQEESPADLGNVLIDLLAYAADYASYYQDAVASEAYLGTARLRHSVKRHARLLDYALHEGCNARVWVQIGAKQDVKDPLPPGTRLLTQTPGLDPILDQNDEPNWRSAISAQTQVFETMHSCQLYAAHNELRFAVREAADEWLSIGSTTAKLIDGIPAASGPVKSSAGSVKLTPGDVLIFEEVRDPDTGTPQRADPNHRHAVRLTKVVPQGAYLEIAWAEADALPFRLFVAPYGRDLAAPFSVARGNVVLADHGRWISAETLPPVPASGRYRPPLRLTGLTHRVPYDHQAARKQAAAATIRQESAWTLPVLHLYQEMQVTNPVKLPANALWRLRYGDNLVTPAKDRPAAQGNRQSPEPVLQEWTLQRDLLNSGPFARDYMVEMEDDRRAYLRFGFGGLGRKPTPSDHFKVEYRIGNGAAGNIGSDTISHIVTSPAFTGQLAMVRNPLPAQSGAEPERLDEARLYAPQAFLSVPQRCVTASDYGERAQAFHDIEHATARIRGVGMWQTVIVYVQRKERRQLDRAFRTQMLAFFEQYRYVGHDIEIRRADFVPLAIELKIYRLPATPRETLRQALNDAFSAGTRSDGEPGFFHPATLGFGQPVYQSRVVDAAMKVAGVTRVDVITFDRLGGAAALDQIQVGPLEIAELWNDRQQPQHGTITFQIE